MTIAGDTIQPGQGQRDMPFYASVIKALVDLVIPINKELITILRTPTPIKVSRVFLTDSNGCIGKGLDTPFPESIYTAPMSAEAWVHRITIYCPEHHPSTPLSTGELLFTGSTAGEVIWFLPEQPDNTQIAPMSAYEGSLSAPHLNPGEDLLLVGDQLPPGIHIRVDLQLVLRQGVSEYTPRISSPTDLDLSPGADVD